VAVVPFGPVTEDKRLEQAILLQDLGVVLGSLWIAHLLRRQIAEVVPVLKPAVPIRDHVHLLLIFLPTWAWFADRLGLQQMRLLVGPLLDLVRALLWTQACGAAAIAVILVAVQFSINRSLIALFLAVSTVLLIVTKLLQRSWVQRTRGQVLALVLESGDEAARELQALRGRRIERLSDADVAHLHHRLRQGGVDEVVLPGGMDRAELRGLVAACEEVGVPALVRLDGVGPTLARPRAEMLGATLYLSYQRHEPDRPSLLIKGLVDRTLAAGGLIMTLPLMLLVALLVKLTSRGPVLFVQRRGGLNGRPFPMLKFRTMKEGAEKEREALLAANEMDGPVFKIANDPRVTPLGRLLRRTSVDELPQLLNVLAGHMSLVGPRPLPIVETRDLVGPYRRRLSMKPGLTCLWQVSGRNELGFEEWMTMDLQYVDNWSLGLDLALLLRTFPAMLSGRGAR
jgi:exopolysaccharide biosynthesis polyprenyl glycosylphosphotransferase